MFQLINPYVFDGGMPSNADVQTDVHIVLVKSDSPIPNLLKDQ